MTAPERPEPGLVVALDGPGSAGKSTVGAAAALELGYRFCDTGLLYRAVTWLALARRVPLDDASALVPLVAEVDLVEDEDRRLGRVIVAGLDVTAEVRAPDVDERVSEVSRVPEVRRELLSRQRAIAAARGIVMAGRDIGTVVLPDADLKLYLDASVEERARRRAEERGLDPSNHEAREILAQLRRRDRVVEPVAVPLRDDIDWYVRFVTLVSRVCVSVFTRVRTSGAFARIPADGPLILAANHASNADAAILQGWLVPRVGRRIHWLGKKEILEWPILGRLARGVSIHPIDRGARDVEAFRTALRILEEGHVLLIFPEGTRSATGEMREGKEGLATLALRSGATIVPLGIVESHRLWPKGGLPRWGARVRLVVGEPFQLADTLSPDLDRRSAKAAATDEVMHRIAALLPPEQRGRWA